MGPGLNSESRAQLFCFHKVPNDVILNTYLLILNGLTCLGQVTLCSLASLHCLGSLASPAGILALKVLFDPTWVYQVQGPFKQKYMLSLYSRRFVFITIQRSTGLPVSDEHKSTQG